MSFVSLQNCRNNFAAGPSDGGKQGNSLLRYPLTFRLRPTAALFLQTLSENQTPHSPNKNKNLQPLKTFFSSAAGLKT